MNEKEITPIKALQDFEWIADKLAYWSRYDIPELDEKYNYSGLLSKVYDALDELEELKRTVKDCITLLTQSGSNTKKQVLEKLRGLVE